MFLTVRKMNRALETLEMINSTWYLKLSWGSKKTPKNLIAGILERLGFSTSTFGELLFIRGLAQLVDEKSN